MDSNLRVRSFAILGILVGAAACADNAPTAPIAKSPLLRRDAGVVAGRRPTRFANTIKYRDKGLKPGRSRAGSATLEARALLGRDGTTVLDISTGVIDAPGAPGLLSKIELKLFAPNGALQTTTKYKALSSPTYQLTLAGRVRGSGVQVKADIVGIDPGTDVVIVNETVKLRPDVSVDRITAPAQSRVRVPVTISALISENNGDVGARSDCVLAVDGAEVDRAHGIWVDAGRSVSCLFNHIFPTTGTKQLTVSAVSVSPGDYEPSNNRAAGTIEIVLPTNELTWIGRYIATKDWTGTSFSQGYWTRPDADDRAEWSDNRVFHRFDTYEAHVEGRTAVMDGPLTLSFHDEIDGTLLNRLDSDPINDETGFSEGTYEDPVFGTVHYRDGCTNGYQVVPIIFEGQETFASPANFLLCTFVHTGPSVPPDQSFTSFSVNTNAGDVSYYGEHWERYNDGTPANENGYTFSFNGETNYAYGTLVFGREYRFALSISGSAVTKTASGTIHLSDPTFINFVLPYQCQDIDDGSFVQHACFTANYTQTLISGSASGTPGP